MSSISLERYRVRHPSEHDTLDRLQSLLRSGDAGRYTLDQIAEQLSAHSREELALILGELAAAGLLNLTLEVRSPETFQPVSEYSSLDQIPPVIPDRTTGRSFNVKLEDVRPIYAFGLRR